MSTSGRGHHIAIASVVVVTPGEMTPASLFGHLRQQGGSTHFFGRTASRHYGLENPDGVNLDVSFANGILHFGLGVTAGVIAAVGNNQNRLARVVSLLHLVHGQVNTIE